MTDSTMAVWGLDGRCAAVHVPKWVRRETGLQDGCPPTPERSPSAPTNDRPISHRPLAGHSMRPTKNRGRDYHSTTWDPRKAEHR